MNLIPWRPRGSIQSFAPEFDDFINSFWKNISNGIPSHLPETFQTTAFPAINIAETENSICISLDCPGMEKEDFEIEAMGSSLVVAGERKWSEEKKGKEFRRVESQYGRFERTVPLPDNVRIEPGKVDAIYKKGVLTITVPKLEVTPAARIEVQSD